MPRVFFDTHDGTTFVRDEIGIDLAGLDEARREAVEGLGCMAKIG